MKCEKRHPRVGFLNSCVPFRFTSNLHTSAQKPSASLSLLTVFFYTSQKDRGARTSHHKKMFYAAPMGDCISFMSLSVSLRFWTPQSMNPLISASLKPFFHSSHILEAPEHIHHKRLERPEQVIIHIAHPVTPPHPASCPASHPNTILPRLTPYPTPHGQTSPPTHTREL